MAAKWWLCVESERQRAIYGPNIVDQDVQTVTVVKCKNIKTFPVLKLKNKRQVESVTKGEKVCGLF